MQNLSEKQLNTLKLLSDTIIPNIDNSASSSQFYRRSATDIGVDKALAEIIETRLEPSLREQFKRLLNILESRVYNLLLTGRAIRFSDLKTQEDRTKYLAGWRDSNIGSKRQCFQAIKRLTCFLFYSITDDKGVNPNWIDIGYPGPTEQTPQKQPEDLRIRGLGIEGDSKLDCDVCAVGSGAGGSVIACELSRAGYNVLVIESGGYETPENFNQRELSMMSKLFDEFGTASTSDLSFVLLSGHGAGGGTTVNWMTSIKPPIEVIRDWENTYGIDGLTGPQFQQDIDEVWRTLKVNQDESQRNGNNEVLWTGCQSLGYKEGVDYEQIWRNAVGCQERCAFCTYGCAYSCKQSTLLNYLPTAFRNGARFLFNTRAERVIVEGGAAKGVEAKFVSASSGRTFDARINARVVVLACGSIKTPALLLRSNIRNKNIGRNLRLHPTTAVSGHFKEEIRAWDGPPQTVVVTKFLHSQGEDHGFWLSSAIASGTIFT